MKCYCCQRDIPLKTQECPVCGLPYPRIAGDKKEYDRMMQEIAGEYRKKNRILLNLLDRFEKMEEALSLANAKIAKLEGAQAAEENIKQKPVKAKETAVSRSVQIGSVMQFGRYPQNSNTDSKTDPIDWIVLAREDNRILLLSQNALDAKPYNIEREDITWETSSLREWLNGSFMSVAFTEEEQEYINKAAVPAEANPKYQTPPGNDTSDRVFLLNIQEIEKYLESDSSRKCQLTTYAKAQGAYSSFEGTGWWWLRSPGLLGGRAVYINGNGDVCFSGHYVGFGSCAVRPALWIDL